MFVNTNLRPLDCKQSNFPSITKPNIIGSFSVNTQRQFVSDYSNLSYLKLPESANFKLNLNDGYEIVKHKPDKDEKIDHLLEFMKINHERLMHQKKLPDFVCFRGLLRLIMCTPYEKKESWTILATKLNNTIYLCAEETDEKRYQKQTETDHSKRFCYYGFKFEQYVLSRSYFFHFRILSDFFYFESFTFS